MDGIDKETEIQGLAWELIAEVFPGLAFKARERAAELAAVRLARGLLDHEMSDVLAQLLRQIAMQDRRALLEALERDLNV